MFGQRTPRTTRLHDAEGHDYCRHPRHHAALPGSLQHLPRRRFLSNRSVGASVCSGTLQPGRTGTGFVLFSSRGSASGASSTYSINDDVDENDNFVNIWEPVPPTPALGRKRKVALMVAAACLELSLTGTLMWAPLLGAIALALLQPTKAEIAKRQEEAVKQAVAATELKLARQLPVTPVESSAWLNRLNQEMWAPFWQPFLLANNLSVWQDTVAAAAPRGWELEITDVSIGNVAPELSGFQAFADPDSGVVLAVDCQMSMASKSVKFAVVGRGPLGSFTAKVSAVSLEGHMRITPLLQHRLLLVGFKEQPQMRVSLSVSAPLFKASLTPGDLGQLDFIQGLLEGAIKDTLVEPARMAISLDADMRVEQAVATTVHLSVDVISGLPRAALPSQGASAKSGAGGSRAAAGRRIALAVVDTTSGVRRSTGAASPVAMRRAVLLREGVSIELPRKFGCFRLEARDMSGSRGVGGRAGTLLGWCRLNVAAARDGTTLFWTHDRSGAPLATRWSPSEAPWRVTLPLTGEAPGCKALEVTLGVAVEPWVYQQPVSGPRGHRSAGPRVVVLQVVEARGLVLPGVSSSAAALHTHVQLCYDQETYCTSTRYNSSDPLFDEVFAFQENPGALTRRIKVDVWHDGPVGTAATRSPAAGAADGWAAGPQGAAAGLLGSADGSGNSRSMHASKHTGRKSSSKGVRSPAAPTTGKGSREGSSSSSSIQAPRPGPAGGGSSRGNHASSGSNGTGRKDVRSYPLSHSSSSLDGAAAASEPDSHMLVDVELEDDDGPRQQGVLQPAGPDGSSSSSGSSINLGSVMINLDQLAESVIQDRWYALHGVEGGEVRLRMALVPGLLGGNAGSSGGSGEGLLAATASEEVSHMLSFFHKSLLGSSRDSVLVEVLSARLFLPLSSLDSSDVDQPAYVLCYDNNASVTLPKHLQPVFYQKPKSKGRPSKRAGNSSSSSSGGGGDGSSAGDSRSTVGSISAAFASTSSAWFDDLLPGNVTQQVSSEHRMAWAAFPLAPVGGAGSTDGDSAAAPAVAAPSLKVLLYDPEEVANASAADTAAIATAAAAAGATWSNQPGGGSGTGVLDHIGSAELAVHDLLTCGGAGPGGSSGAAATATSCWEGWVKLDKDGGHLLVRLTHLPPSEPADLAPPPSAAAVVTNFGATEGSGRGTSSGGTASAATAEAAIAVVAGSGAASAVAAAEGGGSDGSFPGAVGHFVKKTVQEAEHQVKGAVAAVADTAGHWWGTNSINISSWVSRTNQLLPPWSRGAGKGSSESGSGSSDRQLAEQDAEPKGSKQQEQLQQQRQPGNGHQQEQQVVEPEDPAHPLSSVDLSHVVKVWGWKGDEKRQQQPQHIPEHQRQSLQQQRATSPVNTPDKATYGNGSKRSSGNSSSPMPVSSIMAALHSVIGGSGKGSKHLALQQSKQPSAQQQHHMGAVGVESSARSGDVLHPGGPGGGDQSSSTAAAATATQPPRHPSTDVDRSRPHTGAQDPAAVGAGHQQPATSQAAGPVSHPVADLAVGFQAKQQEQTNRGGLLQWNQQQQQQTSTQGRQSSIPSSSAIAGSSTVESSSRSMGSASGSAAGIAAAGAAPAAGVLLSSHPLIVLPSPAAGSGSNALWSTDLEDEEEQQQQPRTDPVWGCGGDASSSDDEF